MTRVTKATPAARGPIRTCVGCGAKKPPRDMLRIAAHAGEMPVVDREHQAVGRGAYVCPTRTCAERAMARRAIERSLKLKNAVPATLKNEIMRAVLEKDEG